ncbi:AAA family ATPase [Streptomyces sp. NPDC090046]
MRTKSRRGELQGPVVPSGRRPRLVLLCGLPGAGKTTVAKRLVPELSAVRLCPDEWLALLGLDLFDNEARERVERCLWQQSPAWPAVSGAAPRRVVGATKYVQYSGAPPPCDARRRTPRA